MNEAAILKVLDDVADALVEWDRIEEEMPPREVPKWLLEEAERYPRLKSLVEELAKPMPAEFELNLLDLADRLEKAR